MRAKWVDLDGYYLGEWVEDGEQYFFSFRLPTTTPAVDKTLSCVPPHSELGVDQHYSRYPRHMARIFRRVKLLAWNIQQGAARRTGSVTDFIAQYAPDVMVLTELRKWSTGLLAGLAAAGWPYQVTAADAPAGAVEIVSRSPLVPLAPNRPAGVLPGRWIELDVPDHGFVVAGVYGPLPGEPYTEFWHSAVDATTARVRSSYILAGDLNTGRGGADAPDPRFFCSRYFEALLGAGLVDVWRQLHGDAREYSYYRRGRGGAADTGFRIDHVLASPSAAGRATACAYLHVGRQPALPDHAPVLATFAPPEPNLAIQLSGTWSGGGPRSVVAVRLHSFVRRDKLKKPRIKLTRSAVLDQPSRRDRPGVRRMAHVPSPGSRTMYQGRHSFTAVTVSVAGPSGPVPEAGRAADALFAELYAELRRRARGLRRRGASETLSTTGLVHESYLKLRGHERWESREHFLNTAARAMRQVLVNAAEARMAVKRGGGAWVVTLDEALGLAPAYPEDLLALHEALQRFEQLSPRQARVVECRYFAGLSVEETAEALGVGPATVHRDWRFARAWLQQALTADANAGA